MYKKKYPVLLLLPMAIVLCLLSTSSCKKTVTHTIIDTFRHAWQPVTYFNSNGQPAWNSVSRGDSELVVAGNTLVERVTTNHQRFDYFFAYPLPWTSLSAPATGAPYVTSGLCAYGNADLLGVTSVPVWSQFSSFVYRPQREPGSYDLHVEPVPSWGRYPASDYMVIRSHYILKPVESYPNDNKTVRFDLLTFDSTKVLTQFGYGDTPVAKQVLLHAADGTLGFSESTYFCAAFFDKFFVYYGGQFFRVDTTGNVKAFGYHPADYDNGTRIDNMFTYGDMLFAKSGGVIFYSRDQGESWELFNVFNNSVSYMLFRNVGRDLYATATTLDMQLWKMAIHDRDLVFTELNNDGLQGNLVTSLTKCGKYVFATTPAGIYYRDSALFDQRKTPD